MQQKTILLNALALSFLALLCICGFVYRKGYTTLADRITGNGLLVADHLTESLSNRMKLVEKYTKLFVFNKEINRSDTPVDIVDRVSAQDANKAFISGFETRFGYQLFESVAFVDPLGRTLVSTEGGDMDYSSYPWWPTLVETGQAYSLYTLSTTKGVLIYARTINGKGGAMVGALIARVYMHALVRNIGKKTTSDAFKSMDLISSDGRLLYSTTLHKPLADMSDTAVFQQFRQGKDWFVHTPQNGGKELVVVRQHEHDITPFRWILAVHMDYNKLFKPMLSMQWWVAAGFLALLLSGVFFFYLTQLIARRNAQQRELVNNQRMLHRILEGIEAAILFIDPAKLTILWANKVTEKIFGEPLGAILGEKCPQFVYDFDTKTDKDVPCPISGAFHQEFQLKRKDGLVIPVTKTVVEVMNGRRPIMVAILFDMTERKNIERQLAHVKKLESIGSLAAGIAHEINTPTQYIGDNLHFLRQAMDDCQKLMGVCEKWRPSSAGQLPPPEAVAEAVEVAGAFDLDYLLEEIPTAITQSLDGVHRISSIVGAMKHFSHPGADSMQLGDINNALVSTSLVCRNEWKYKAEMHYDLDPDLPPVLCFVNDINQVFLNVLINSAHAIDEKYADNTEKGSIILKTRRDGNDVVITIRDTGVGVDREALERVFDHFYTTKEVGQGTGQGLALSYSIIVNKHHGSIEMDSVKGEWTECIIQLPIGKASEAHHE